MCSTTHTSQSSHTHTHTNGDDTIPRSYCSTYCTELTKLTDHCVRVFQLTSRHGHLPARSHYTASSLPFPIIAFLVLLQWNTRVNGRESRCSLDRRTAASLLVLALWAGYWQRVCTRSRTERSKSFFLGITSDHCHWSRVKVWIRKTN